MSPESLKTYLKEQGTRVDAALDRFLPSDSDTPETIHKAMRHSMFAGGKRLRPIFCLAAAEACEETDADAAMAAACAVECIHTYSLIHDDLPCMDDDDFRRGHPTCHKVYGDAVAVLAGDALQALAFELVAGMPGSERYSAGDMVKELAVTSGSKWLIGGQVMDLEGEGKDLSPLELREIHMRKTAALLATSLRLGAMVAGATPQKVAAVTEFGHATGLAFQVIDDILDVTQTSEKLGKSAGKDEASGKATYPAILGMEESKKQAERLTEKAQLALTVFGEKADTLRALAGHLLGRDM